MKNPQLCSIGCKSLQLIWIVTLQNTSTCKSGNNQQFHDLNATWIYDKIDPFYLLHLCIIDNLTKGWLMCETTEDEIIKISHLLNKAFMILILCILMDSSFQFDTINSG